MPKKRFFENPLPLVLRALRKEQGLTPKGFADELSKLHERETNLKPEFESERYLLFENADYDYEDVKIDEVDGAVLINKDKHLPISIANAISRYYDENVGIPKIFEKKVYTENEYAKSGHILDLINSMRFENMDAAGLAKLIGVEEISVLSWISGEREVSKHFEKFISQFSKRIDIPLNFGKEQILAKSAYGDDAKILENPTEKAERLTEEMFKKGK